MSAKPSSAGPDAWEDDWESQADRLSTDPTPPSEKKVSSKVSKAQRRAQQAEFNRQLWAEAESPQTFHFLESRSDVPLKQEYKPTVTLLSRNPPSKQSAVDATTAGVGRLGLNHGTEDDSEEESKPPEPTPEERQAIALRNREEKQRKYEEVRERLFGSPSATTSGASSPRSGTPPKQHEGRGKGRSRGNGRDNNNTNNNRDKRDSSSTSGKSRQLYDPASSYVPRKERPQTADRSPNDPTSPRQPIRSPRGPDASGRGGFRSGNRGARGG
ncbi:hypothetical protein P170DRAFT_470524 [Aspergillus steynii IBT 23096]|uniref:Uncharacterized protein n=1 Tax=Aspergillus steynii IBT 23096 TaxID=1392250 RepID=A0A2I2GQG3_9EURO|nr:uncharacterized protein P170DRAFT_470524 [Aspergillus steynii IBT 23096]PLB55101.1 hypothetical protein P170DRAFT_470524 [Aspergillus steynii IBT 23096]